MENKDRDSSLEIKVTLPLTAVLLFLVKTLVVCVAVVITVRAITPELPKIEDTPKNRLLLIGLINNPYVLTKLSLLQEESGSLEKALMLAEAALSLQQLHNSNERTYSEYAKRIHDLREKLKQNQRTRNDG